MPSYAIIPSENPPNPCANDIPFRNVAFLLPDCQIQLQTCPAAPSNRLKSIFKVLNASFGLLPMVVNRSRKSFWNLAVPSHCLIWENFEQVADCLIIANWANYSLQWREWYVYNCIYRKQGAHFFSPVPKNTQKRSKKTMQHQCSSLWLSTMIITICAPMATIPPLEYYNCWLPIVTIIQWLWSSNSSQ